MRSSSRCERVSPASMPKRGRWCETKNVASPLQRGLTVPRDETTLAFVPVLPPAARQIMFHARIVSPRGSLYLAAEATPYDLENLRTHVHDLRMTENANTRLELRIDRPSNGAAYRRV